MADLDAVMRALSAPTRREILGLVWDRELPAGDIAAAFSLSAATISEHLGVLRDAGLVDMTRVGTSRRYRARRSALAGLHGALEGANKWVSAQDIPERRLTRAVMHHAVVVEVDVETDQQSTFAAFTEAAVYSRWLGAPVSISDGRFAATMEWGTEIRGRYELVVPPQLVVMTWDFEDDNVPVPGRPLTGYLHVHPNGDGGAHVEVHQLAESAEQAEFMRAAWGMVLGRLRKGVAAASDPATEMPRRRPRPKR